MARGGRAIEIVIERKKLKIKEGVYYTYGQSLAIYINIYFIYIALYNTIISIAYCNCTR